MIFKVILLPIFCRKIWLQKKNIDERGKLIDEKIENLQKQLEEDRREEEEEKEKKKRNETFIKKEKKTFMFDRVPAFYYRISIKLVRI